jgi:hypothetical protein
VAQARRHRRYLHDVGDVFMRQPGRLVDAKIIVGDGVGDFVRDHTTKQRHVVGNAEDRFLLRHFPLAVYRRHQNTVLLGNELTKDPKRGVFIRMQKHAVENVDPHHRVDGKALLRQERDSIGGAGAR